MQTKSTNQKTSDRDQPFVRNVPIADGVWISDDGVRFDIAIESFARLGDLVGLMDNHDGYEAIVGMREGELMLAVKDNIGDTIEDGVKVAECMVADLNRRMIGGKMLHPVGA